MKKGPLSIEELYNVSIRTLKIFKNEIESEKKINEAIYKLIAKKIIIRGTKLTKDTVLLNEKRQNIYRYISKNPGSHLRDIREKLNLNPQLAAWHLKMLEKFDFIRKNRIKNKNIYFNSYIDSILDEKIFTLKDPKNFKILENILFEPGITLNELAKKVKINYEKVKKIISNLTKFEFVNTENNETSPRYFSNLKIVTPILKILKIPELKIDIYEESERISPRKVKIEPKKI